jgi:CheY-like chemotaxis protein
MSHVLVIEDDVSLRSLIILVLEFSGYRITTAGNGIEGLQRVEAEMPDLILLDMRMPVMSGAEFAVEYQARYGGDARAPIIVITAAEHAARHAREIGANGFLAKPFTNKELVRTVEKHIRTDREQSVAR